MAHDVTTTQTSGQLRTVGAFLLELARLIGTAGGIPLIVLWLSRVEELLLIRWYPAAFSTVPLVETGIQALIAAVPFVPITVFILLGRLIPGIEVRLAGGNKLLGLILWLIYPLLWFALPAGLISFLFHVKPWIGASALCGLVAFRVTTSVYSPRDTDGQVSDDELAPTKEPGTEDDSFEMPKSLADELALIVGSIMGMLIGIAVIDRVWIIVKDAAFPTADYPSGPESLVCVLFFVGCCLLSWLILAFVAAGMALVGFEEAASASRKRVLRSWKVGAHHFRVMWMVSPLFWLFSGFGFLFWYLALVLTIGVNLDKCPLLLKRLHDVIMWILARVRNQHPQATAESEGGTEVSPMEVLKVNDTNQEEQVLRFWRQIVSEISFFEVSGFALGVSLEIACSIAVSRTSDGSMALLMIGTLFKAGVSGVSVAGYIAILRMCLRPRRWVKATDTKLVYRIKTLGPFVALATVVGCALWSFQVDVPILWRRQLDPVVATLETISTVIHSPLLPAMILFIVVMLLFVVVGVGCSLFLLTGRLFQRLRKSSPPRNESGL